MNKKLWKNPELNELGVKYTEAVSNFSSALNKGLVRGKCSSDSDDPSTNEKESSDSSGD